MKMKLTGMLLALLPVAAIWAGNGKGNSNNHVEKGENKMEVTALTREDFLKQVYNFEANPKTWKFEGTKPCLVDFYATWCGPCKMLAPVLEEIAKEYEGKVNIYKVDVDKESDLAGEFGIRSVPTLLLCPVGEEPKVVQGAMPKTQLRQIIDEVLLKAK